MKTIPHGTYRAIRAGKRGIVIHLPTYYTKANNIEPGDLINLNLVDRDKTILLVKAINARSKK